jgi:anti-sigma B factor antagonist
MRDARAEEFGSDGVVMHPEGRLDLQSAQDFRTRIADLVTGGRTKVVLDLSATTFMDSSGLGALIAALKTARQAGGDLRIAEVPAQVATVLELTQMHRVIRSYDRVEDAKDGM